MSNKPRPPPSVLQCELPGCGKVRIVRQTDVRWYDENVPRSHRFECSELWHCKCADRADDDDPKTKSKWIDRGGRALIDGPQGHILPSKNPYFDEKPLSSAAREQATTRSHGAEIAPSDPLTSVDMLADPASLDDVSDDEDVDEEPVGIARVKKVGVSSSYITAHPPHPGLLQEGDSRHRLPRLPRRARERSKSTRGTRR